MTNESATKRKLEVAAGCFAFAGPWLMLDSRAAQQVSSLLLLRCIVPISRTLIL